MIALTVSLGAAAVCRIVLHDTFTGLCRYSCVGVSDRLRHLTCMHALEKRQVRGDSIEVWRTRKGREIVENTSLITLDANAVVWKDGYQSLVSASRSS